MSPTLHQDTTSHSTPPEETYTARHHVCGMGASAGGLEALSQLIGSLPSGLACAFVIAQHTSPDNPGVLAHLIGRTTRLEVKSIEDGERPRPGVVYVAPPNRNLALRDGAFTLLEPRKDIAIAPKPSIDLLFQSIAEAFGEHAIGVVLSGTGDDGAAGLRAIKAGGGLTLAQTLDSARYAGMPQAAIQTANVDHILPPERIALELARWVRSGLIAAPTPLDEADKPRLVRLIEDIRQRTRIDFSGYKEPTLLRRIRARMAAQGVESLGGYLELAAEQPAEYDALAKDVLISVTSFFRDGKAFEQLAAHIEGLIEAHEAGRRLRIWVPGCATGEEAYSIAMILAALLGDDLWCYDIQIFATDIDLDALDIARRAHYPPAALAALPAGYERFFIREGEQYALVKRVRELVMFARQDVAHDPPFLRLDLVSCRNLLIYLGSDLQARVLERFHYALDKDGLLFLGNSENISQAEDLFDLAEPGSRLFKPRATNRFTRGTSYTRRPRTAPERPRHDQRAQTAHSELLHRLASEAYLPPSVLLDRRLHIVHSSGNLRPYLRFPRTSRAQPLPQLLEPPLRTDLFALVHLARNGKAVARGLTRRMPPDGGAVQLVVHPYHAKQADEMFLVCFEPVAQPNSRGAPLDASREGELEEELVATRTHLQGVRPQNNVLTPAFSAELMDLVPEL